MNEYTYDEIPVGLKESFSVCVTEQMLDSFREITGDINPLHCDNEFANKINSGYPGRVCYGMLTASFLSTLAGVYLPGKYCLIHEISAGFTKPVFPGDMLNVTGEVVEKNDLFKQLTLKVKIINQYNQTVLRGKMKTGVFR